MINEYCKILDVYISAVNMQETVNYLTTQIEDIRGQYVCIANVHTTVTAHKDADYRNIQNHSVLTLPDGNPLSVACRKCGFADTTRVTGPDLMTELFKLSESNGYRHYFYGSSQNTLLHLEKCLKENYPKLVIAGMYSPPYRTLTEEEEKIDIDRINQTNPDYIWIGLGAPKQERWMYRNQGKLHGLMIGVGAGFDFHAGLIKRAPIWMQRLSLEWLFRLAQSPKYLWKRYFRTNGYYIFKQICGKAYHVTDSRCSIDDKIKSE